MEYDLPSPTAGLNWDASLLSSGPTTLPLRQTRDLNIGFTSAEHFCASKKDSTLLLNPFHVQEDGCLE